MHTVNTVKQLLDIMVCMYDACIIMYNVSHQLYGLNLQNACARFTTEDIHEYRIAGFFGFFCGGNISQLGSLLEFEGKNSQIFHIF